MKRIAFIDFDGTIYHGDSMLDFATVLRGKGFVRSALFKSSFNILLKKLKIRSSQKAKEQFLGYVLQGQSSEDISRAVTLFTEQVDARIFQTANEELRLLASKGVEIVIVSASCELWLRPWCESKGYRLIASRLKTVENGYNGQLDGQNCKGEEKVRRIKKEFDLSTYGEIYCYGNDASDQAMVNLATEETRALYR